MTVMQPVEFIKDHPKAVLPTYATEGSSGMDLSNCEVFSLKPGERKLVSTGLRIALCPGMEAQVRPRSGLALKHGITVLNSPGTIDSDYRGDLGVILINLGQEEVTFTTGARIAQLVIKPVITNFKAMEVTQFTFPNTKRGESGYGSTGL